MEANKDGGGGGLSAVVLEDWWMIITRKLSVKFSHDGSV